jgi:hypothetical protein
MSDPVVQPADLPGTVSDVYWRLKDYIQDNYPETDQGTRFLIFAVAYMSYCERKKVHIQERRLERPPPKDSDLRTAHTNFRTPTSYGYFAGVADQIVKGYKAEEVNRLVTAVLEKNKPTLGEHVKSHLITLAIIGLFITIWPKAQQILFDVLRGQGIGTHLHDLGVWLSTNF